MEEQNTPKRPFPLSVIVLDFLGVLLLALGAYLLFNTINTLVPESLRFAHDGLILMISGFLLTLPMLFHIINAAKTRNRWDNTTKPGPTVR